MSPLTLYLARGFGLFCLIMCLILAMRPRASIAAVNSIVDTPGTLLTIAVVTLAGGIACVLLHTIWTGGLLSVVVTLLGWATLVKGAVLLATPPGSLRALYRGMHYPQTFRLTMVGGAVFGAALTAAAFNG
jgi:hypothetical protein